MEKGIEIKKCVGRKIQEFRKRKNLTQEQLAEAVGIDTISISKIETGRSYPTSENLAKIAQILSVEPAEFFMFSFNKSDKDIVDEIKLAIDNISKDSKKLTLLYNIIKAIV